MDLRDYLRVLRKRWRLVCACVLLAVIASSVLTWRATPVYRASTQLFVAAHDSSSDFNSLVAGGQFSQQRVQSYADIVNSPEVTEAVAEQLDSGLTAKQVAAEVSASAPLNTVLINVNVNDTSPVRAQNLANAVSDEFARFASDLEAPPGSLTSPVKITVVKRAELPVSPVSPRPTLNLALAFLAGLAVGIGASVLRDAFDTTIKDPEQLQRELGISLLGAIAYDSDAPKRPLIVHVDPRSSRAEAFKQLRTNLQFVDIDRAPRSIVVTSSVPAEGKTTTTANLAIALSQSGLRVLLVEGDLRRPKLAEYLGLEGAVGLTNVLIGRVGLEDALQPWGPDDRLHVLLSGPMPPNPSELLGSQGMADLIRDLESTYDLVLIDAPPLLPVTDAAVLAAVCSGAVVVAKYGQTRREQIARAVESLRTVGTTVYGAVLTMTPLKGPDSYYYGYGYRYDTKARPEMLDSATPIGQRARAADARHTAGERSAQGGDEQPENSQMRLATGSAELDVDTQSPGDVGQYPLDR